MSDIASDPCEETEDKAEIALEYELDAKPEKVWRAIAVAAFRERWLPNADLAEPEPIASVPGRGSLPDAGGRRSVPGKHRHLPDRARA